MGKKIWTEQETTDLIKYYPEFGPKDCQIFFPDRTKKSIMRKAHNLNLNYEGQIWNNVNFVKRAILVHGIKYDYSLVVCTNFNSKVVIICPKHGNFFQRTNCHIINGHGCPACKESKGERSIRNFLIENNISFISQYTFEKCIGKRRKLPFDFYLPDYNLCIEYHGIQHYEPIKYFGGDDEFINRLNIDKIKKEYCHINNIPFLELKYNEDIILLLNNYLLKVV